MEKTQRIIKNKRTLTKFGQEVKIKTCKKGMTLADVAKVIGVNPNYLSNILYGEKKNSCYVPKIAEFLEINLDKYIA